MASPVTVRLPVPPGVAPGPLQTALQRALAVFAEVETACTRFVATSPLMRANDHPEVWHRVPAPLFDALVAAADAHRSTGGRFDPRVLTDLTRLGYGRSLPFEAGPVEVPADLADPADPAGPADAPPASPSRRPVPWHPRFQTATREVHLDGSPVDLGGIGKGLAIRWAGDRLATVTSDFLVEAGGDCLCAGLAADGGPWRVGVEDPLGGEQVAVLAVSDRACATSSIRLRRWRAGGRWVHHLIDPYTGEPGGAGLLSVTVVHSDPAIAEVASKVHFLAGLPGIAREVETCGYGVIWVDDNGVLRANAAAGEYVQWLRT
jgi:thiamine biosynthesis lipoprotein